MRHSEREERGLTYEPLNETRGWTVASEELRVKSEESRDRRPEGESQFASALRFFLEHVTGLPLSQRRQPTERITQI